MVKSNKRLNRGDIIDVDSGNDIGFVISTTTLDELKACPEAFLLSEDETVLVTKARQLLQSVNDKYKDIPKEDFNDNIKARVCAEFISQAKTKRLPLTKLKNLIYKFQGSQYWTVLFIGVDIESDKNNIHERLKLLTSNPDIKVSSDNVFDRKTHPEYFKAATRAEKARALNIPGLFYYIPAVELDTLSILTVIFKHETNIQESPADKAEDDELFYHIIDSKQLNAFYAIGQNVKNPKIKKGRDEKGKQIDLAEYGTNIGVGLSFEDFNPFNTDEGKKISIGEPNADKLLLQAQLVCLKSQRQAFEISITDFMTFRQVKDRKSAIEQATRACETLLKASYKITAENESGSIRGGINYVQECYVKTSSGRGGNKLFINLSDKLYQHILTLSLKGQQIELLDKRAASIPNNQATAYNIFREFSSNLHKNSDKPTSHRLSVQKLLSYCSALPLYPAKSSDIGKEDYLRKRSEAGDRIITPFVKALDYLVDKGFFAEYTFTHPKGKPLTNSELTKVYDDYNLFVSLNVDVVFTNEPNYDHLNESRAEQKAKAEKAKKTKAKKNQK